MRLLTDPDQPSGSLDFSPSQRPFLLLPPCPLDFENVRRRRSKHTSGLSLKGPGHAFGRVVIGHCSGTLGPFIGPPLLPLPVGIDESTGPALRNLFLITLASSLGRPVESPNPCVSRM